MFDKQVNFTFSNAGVKSYIDHILDKVTNCKILNFDIDNMSDHYALSFSMDVSVYKGESSETGGFTTKQNIYHRWHDSEFQLLYSCELTKALTSVVIPQSINPSTVTSYVNEFDENVCSAMKEAAVTTSRNFATTVNRRKPWWNYDCTTTRNCYRLFYKIWHALDDLVKDSHFYVTGRPASFINVLIALPLRVRPMKGSLVLINSLK